MNHPLPHAPVPVVEAKPEPDVRLQKPWNVILWNDDDHSFEYVVEMLGRLFAHPSAVGMKMAMEVHTSGRCVVATLPKERAEFQRDRIHGYGADPRIPRCKGAMSASIETAEA